MDELALALGMDPVELRLRNEPLFDEGLQLPFSSRHLKECLAMGAQKFGWAARDPRVGAMKRDGLTLGWGMASASWQAARYPCAASVELCDDGTARVFCATQDIGTGSYTIVAQLAAETLGLPLARVEAVLGDTRLPPGPVSGGSGATAAVVPAVLQAARAAIDALLLLASRAPPGTLAGRKAAGFGYGNGRVHGQGEPAASGIAFDDLLRLLGARSVSGAGSSEGRGVFGTGKPEVSSHSFGAHFVEVTWQPEIARLRVSRVVTVIDAGRILNPLAGRNQIEGAVAMGIGMCLFEETAYDQRSGAPINANLADYIVATNADVPALEVHFIEYPDTSLNELGARGIGEIGLAGAAAAIANAVHHATGVRVRELPVRIEDLLT
jgi:xanthine dehydrogenase YagR molybdenum-binding subunit